MENINISGFTQIIGKPKDTCVTNSYKVAFKDVCGDGSTIIKAIIDQLEKIKTLLLKMYNDDDLLVNRLSLVEHKIKKLL